MNKTLEPFINIADGFARLLKPYAEVVLHNLATEQVVYLANNFSKREIGSPSLLNEIELNEEANVIGPYEKLNWDGRRLKSISMVLRDHKKEAIGLMCINLDISHFEKMKHLIQAFITVDKPIASQTSSALFAEDWHEKINIYLHQWLKQNDLSLNALEQHNKKKIVIALAQQGAFQGKKAAEYVANILNLGRATIYKYIKEAKSESF